MATRRRLRIGEWIADPGTLELVRGAERARLEPKAMDVLLHLAAQAGSVVSREELFTAVWPGMVVGDEALTQSITKLRRALGDDSRTPRYIETIAKRGYRLVAPVSPAEGPAASARPSRAGLAAAAAVVAVLAGAAFLLLRGTPPSPTPPPDLAGNERAEAWVTVTVLPFEWLGASKDEAYLAQGISENLATGLARLSSLRVIRASSDTPAARAARYIATGSVQREAGRVRVNVHLLDARTNEQLWSDRFEAPYADLFAVQDDLIRRLVQALPAQVSDAERQRLAKRYTRSLEAYDHFMRAQALFLVRGAGENQEARAQYRMAIDADPRFARAYAGLAMTYAMEHRLRPETAGGAALERARELAESARQIDPEVALVHWALGFVHAQGRRHEEALASLRKAIALDPSFADAYALMAGIHTYVGKPAESIPLLRTAMRFNPEGGYLYYLVLGRAYFFEDDHEQALINLREALLRNPADLETRVYIAAALMASGDRAAASWEAEEIRSLDGGFSMERWLESYPLASTVHRERLRALLAAAGL